MTDYRGTNPALSKFTDDELRTEIQQRRIERLRTRERYYSGWIAPLVPRITELSDQGLTVPEITRSIQRDGLVKDIRGTLGSINENALACSIRNVMKILGIQINASEPDMSNRLQERWKHAYNLRQNGKTFREIGKILGVNPTRASQLVKKGENIFKLST